eukprot:CAMPEP_0171080796 /NCGR_PEP_ID=MMETSP0766_2-20121228/16094_1 /TAXON_ID=439317 /ORGANISM="Gambierdiscus australes, Strain CAWD 149" /LENGTH=456 /DNA_ID=CAMNT_0011538067 /DNA_START=75 /DNA_END=1445 /DNA_ORIENTATION=+
MAGKIVLCLFLPILACGTYLRSAPPSAFSASSLNAVHWTHPILTDLDLLEVSANSTSLADYSVEALYTADGPVQLLHGPLPRMQMELVEESGEVRARKEHPYDGWKRVIIRMVVVLACASAVFSIFSFWHAGIRERSAVKVEHVCCLAYASLSISIDLSIKNAARVNGGKYSFNPACAVVTVEVLKLVVSMILFTVNARMQVKEGIELVLPSLKDVAWLMVPGFVYTCNNIIVFEAIGHCPLGAFGVIRETMLIWNAVLWTIVFQAAIGRTRWFAIVLLFVGCVVNQLPAFFRAEFTWGVLWAFLLAFSNAAGGVANEYAMKRKAAMDINLQNCILYFFCGSFGMIYLLVFQMSDLQRGFFNGFSPQCIQVVVLQMLTGLAVSRILKYVDAVTKTIVAAFRGPGVIFFGAWIFHTRLHISEIVATIVVCVACFIYLREGPLVKAADAAAKEIKDLK